MANKMAVLPVLPEWEEMKANFQQMKANVIQAQDQIKRLSTVCWKLAKERDDLTKERDALLEDNINLQVETFQWQDKVYNMKMATKSAAIFARSLRYEVSCNTGMPGLQANEGTRAQPQVRLALLRLIRPSQPMIIR